MRRHEPLPSALTDRAAAARHSPSLFAFAIFYGGMVCIAGVLGNKQVALGPLAVEAGIFAFLLLVVTSSAVAELHGRATANRLVLIGFVPLIVSLLLSLLVLAVPPRRTWTRAPVGFERSWAERRASGSAASSPTAFRPCSTSPSSAG